MSSLHVCGAATGFEPSTCGQRTDVCVCVWWGGGGAWVGGSRRVWEREGEEGGACPDPSP